MRNKKNINSTIIDCAKANQEKVKELSFCILDLLNGIKDHEIGDNVSMSEESKLQIIKIRNSLVRDDKLIEEWKAK